MENLKLYPPLKEVLAFGQYPEKVNALFKFDRGINKRNMFGDNVAYYKEEYGLKNGHNGIDISCKRGTKVVASHPGYVHEIGKDVSAGLGVVLVSDKPYKWLDGSEAYAKTIYWHNLENLVEVGSEVKIRQVIALADNTGYSTGHHLHFGLKQCKQSGKTINWNNGQLGAVDPYQYFNYWNLNMEHTCNDNCKLNTDEKFNLAYEFGFGREPDEKGKKFWEDKCIWTFLREAVGQQEHKRMKKILQIGNLILSKLKR